MIIQCEQCRTKFKLDDNKVTERGAKVRCAKCRHVFIVRKSADTPAEEASPAVTTPATPVIPPTPAFDAGKISFADVDIDETPAPAAPAAAAPPAVGLDFGTVLPQARDIEPSPEISFDFGEVSASPVPQQNISFDFTTKPAAVAAAPAGDIDFGGFDFGDVSVATPDDSFSLGDAEFIGLSAVRQPATASDDLGFSFGDAEQQPVAAPSADGFGVGDFEFGTEAASVAMPADAAQASGLFDFGTVEPTTPVVASAPEEPPATNFAFEPGTEDEPSPLSIASRRRQSPIISAVVVLACLLLVGALGFMGYLFLGNGTKPVPFFGKPASPEEGKITVQQVQASFLTKAKAGDMLIIRGEALNSFSKPRGALQVKATLFGANNETVVTQLAYAGNQLTREQLASLPQEKIEAAMNNQFGDSLINLAVAPGKTIPFTLVILNPPATAKDFSVEAAGSTIATSK